MKERESDRLLELWREIRDLDAATALLSWDQETFMPPRGVEGRAGALATLAGITHDRLTAPALQDVLAAADESAEPESEMAAQVRRARHRVDRAAKVPVSLAKALAEASSRALASWKAAREASDYPAFSDDLAQIIDLKRQEAAAISSAGNAYDVLLDEYEPGVTVAQLEPMFADLRRDLAPIVQGVADSGIVIDESPARGSFPVAFQEAFCREVATAIGFDFKAGRLDASAHPFCTGIDAADVRMTWRWDETDFRPGLYGVVHETGHGLYEQGLPEAWRGTPIGEAVSLGIHESQSRLWENHVGRSRAFWQWALPRFAKHFGKSSSVSLDALWTTLQVVRPSLIRVEADQVTYNLHVAIRFEIERAIFSGEIEVEDLPERWNDLYQELLGVRPANDAEGVLQDVHWALGAFGYFPTYTLGTLAAAQLYEEAGRQLGDLDAIISKGDFGVLLEWLRTTIHRHGSRFEAAELIRRASSSELSADAFLAHVRQLAADVYGVTC
jgi:carboxypeptidase Taq